MKIFLNGEATECEEQLTIAQLIERHGLLPEATLVEHNGSALRARDWPEKTLLENDRLEILLVAAGG